MAFGTPELPVNTTSSGTNPVITLTAMASPPQAVVFSAVKGIVGTSNAISSVSLDQAGVITQLTLRAVAVDTAGEPGSAELWAAFAAFSSGASTLRIGKASTDLFLYNLVSFPADTTVALFLSTAGAENQNQVNPSMSLALGSSLTHVVGNLYDGLGATTASTENAGQTRLTSFDFGAFIGQVSRTTTSTSGTFSWGWTAAADDVAMTAVAIQEVVAGGAAAVMPPFTFCLMGTQ